MKKNDIEKDKYASFICLIIVIIILWLLSIIFLYIIFPEMKDRGAFGDMFGAVNALFSGAALAGVVYAIILQKKELRLQRKEMKYTRQELKRSAEAHEKSEEALSKQAESLKATAKLNGLSSLLSHYNKLNEINSHRNKALYKEFSNINANEIVEEIKNIVKQK